MLLTTTSRLVSDSHEFRRKYERKTYSADVVFASDGRIMQGSLKDISIGGAFIQCKHASRLLEGEVVTVSIPFTDGKRHVKRKGQILWRNSTGFAVSFQ